MLCLKVTLAGVFSSSNKYPKIQLIINFYINITINITIGYFLFLIHVFKTNIYEFIKKEIFVFKKNKYVEFFHRLTFKDTLVYRVIASYLSIDNSLNLCRVIAICTDFITYLNSYCQFLTVLCHF